MRSLYTKLTIALFAVLFINSSAQAQWEIGEPINDVFKYLTVEPFNPANNDTTTCMDLGNNDYYFIINPCLDPGIDYGFYVTEITSEDTVEIAPDGPVFVGDTIWLDDWNTAREISFQHISGHISLEFFAVGAATIPDIEVPCMPADSMWIMFLPICNAQLVLPMGCYTEEATSVNELNEEISSIIYPALRNNYQLSVESTQAIENIFLYDVSGKMMLQSNTNTVDCNYLNDGTYIMAVQFENGSVESKKFVLVK